MLVSLCTIIYELLIGSISSYFLGDSIRQFSITIGLIMFSMGFGTYLTRLIKKDLIFYFVFVEILIALIGGLSVPFLYASFAFTEAYYLIMIILIFLIGTLIGLEIPLLTRILEEHYPLKINISNVLSFDYFGALIATLIFPFFLLPFFGLLNASLLTGLLNLLVSLVNFFWFRKKITTGFLGFLKKLIFCSFLVLICFLFFSKNLIYGLESSIYQDQIILSKQTKYQKIVLTKFKNDLRLFLNGNLQFSSLDEYRYHEPLVHIPMSLLEQKKNILILGGGDGLVAREILKYSSQVRKITLVDLDPEIVELAKNNRFFRDLNQDSLKNPKVKVFNQDAFIFLKENSSLYDLIIADLPDPNNTSLARMYTKEFYNLVQKRLSRAGIFVTQSTSPYFASEAFWCINQTIQASNLKYVYAYHAYVPSFGDWGYNLATNFNLNQKIKNLEIQNKKIKLKFLNSKLIAKLFVFPKDSLNLDLKISSLNEPNVLNYYLKGWQKHN